MLMHGSSRAVLVTSGRAASGLVRYAQRLLGGQRPEVVLTSASPEAIAGLESFRGITVHVPAGGGTTKQAKTSTIADGDTIDLGRDDAGRTVSLEVHALAGAHASAITLLDRTSRVLFAGDALGTQGTPGLTLPTSAAQYREALTAWRASTDGAYDTLYTSHNHQWVTRPGYVDSLEAATTSALVTSPVPGCTARTAGTGELLAWVFESA